MPASGIGLADYSNLLRGNRNFRLLWSAQIVSELGDWFYSVAIFSFLLQVAGTAQSIAFAFMLQVLPQCLGAPAAGVINDRMSRRKVMLFADWMRAGIVLSMLLVRSREMLWLLYILLFSETLMWSLFEPARSAVVPNIAPGPQIMAANALQSTTWSFNFAIGAALGGVVAALFGRQTVFVLNSLSFVASALLIRRMQFDEPHAKGLARLRARDLMDYSPIAEGFAYVRRDPRLAATIFVQAGLSLMGTNWVLLPVMGEKLFPLRLPGFNQQQATTMGMSILLGARGVGALIGAFTGARITGIIHGRLRASITIGFLLGGLGYLALSGAPIIWAACGALVLAHAGGSIIWTSSTTLMQDMTEDRFRGRVFSAEFAFSMFTLAVVSYVDGWLLDHGVGLRTLAFATGIMFFLPALAWMYAQRLWRDL
jgi:MFS family permease